MTYPEIKKEERARTKVISTTLEVISKNAIRGMMFSMAEGKRLAKEHPEIVDEYRAGKRLVELGEEYSKGSERSMSAAMNSIYYCLREFVAQGIISEEELKQIGKEHMSKYGKINGRKGGKITFKRGIGCFGISKKKRREISQRVAREMGKKYGKKNYEAGLGIAEMSLEERKAATRKGLEALGMVPYDIKTRKTKFGKMSEKDYVIYLREVEGLNWEGIEEKVNSVFRNSRNAGAIRTNYNTHWRVSFEGEEKKTPYDVMDEKAYVNYLKDIKELDWDKIARRTNKIFRNNRCANLIRDSYNGKGWKPLFDGRKRKTAYGKMTERAYVFYLKENTNMSWQEITEDVNKVFKNGRSQGSVVSVYNRKRGKEK